MRVEVEIHLTDVEGDYGRVDGISAVCMRCGQEVEVAGTGSASARRAAAMLREECLKGENNYYDVDFLMRSVLVFMRRFQLSFRS